MQSSAFASRFLQKIYAIVLVDPLEEPVGDADSGMSTSHSPDDNYKHWSGAPGHDAGHEQDTLSPVSPSLDTSAMAHRLELLDPTHRGLHRSELFNDLTIEWNNLNPLSHPNATLVPQARQAKASSENLNYVILAPHEGKQGKVVKF